MRSYENSGFNPYNDNYRSQTGSSARNYYSGDFDLTGDREHRTHASNSYGSRASVLGSGRDVNASSGYGGTSTYGRSAGYSGSGSSDYGSGSNYGSSNYGGSNYGSGMGSSSNYGSGSNYGSSNRYGNSHRNEHGSHDNWDRMGDRIENSWESAKNSLSNAWDRATNDNDYRGSSYNRGSYNTGRGTSTYGSGYDSGRSNYGGSNYSGSNYAGSYSRDYNSGSTDGLGFASNTAYGSGSSLGSGYSGLSNYGSSNYNSGSGGYSDDYDNNDRGFFDRAGDEVKSWFGDDEAERRRRMDEMRDRREDSDYDSYNRNSSSYGNTYSGPPYSYGSSSRRDYEW